MGEHELYRSFKSKISTDTAVDVLLDRVERWLVTETPDGVVIVVKGPQAQELADLARTTLQLREGAPHE